MANSIPIVIADFETSLASAISAGATSLTLASATDDDGNALAAGKYCFTINNGSSNKQYLIGQLNGTTVTSVVSVDRRGNETSGAANAARAGSPVIISDFATIQRVADILRGQEELDGDNPITYDAEPTLANRAEVATVGYVLDQVSGGTVNFDNQIISSSDAIAGETIAAGDWVFFNTADQEWYEVDADTAAEVYGAYIGVALGSGTDGVSITGGVQISGVYTTTGLTPGSVYYLSNTAGTIGTSAGTTERAVGVALSSTKLLMNLQEKQLPTAKEKDAMVGDTTPDSTNTFLTKGKKATAGATINGASLPVPVYQNKTDNEFYACDANDTSAMKFLGFAISNGTDGADMYVQYTGIVSGFTGLSEGEKYYVQDTAGTIGTSIGTYEILVGVAISETELLIQKGKRRRNGVLSFSDAGDASASQDTAITLGFRPSSIRANAFLGTGSSGGYSAAGSYVNGVYSTATGSSGSATVASTETNYIIKLGSGDDLWWITITSVTDTGFTFHAVQNGIAPDTIYITWEAEGEL